MTTPVMNRAATWPLSAPALRRIAAGLAACLAVGAAALGPSPASAATKTEKSFDAWTVVCVENDDQAKRCSMTQSRIRAQDKKFALLWTISAGEDNTLTQTLAVPAGISIKEGIRLFVGDGDPQTLGYDVCGPRVCLARAPFDGALAETIKGASKASASYVLGSKQLMQVEFDLTGFAAAYDYFISQLS